MYHYRRLNHQTNTFGLPGYTFYDVVYCMLLYFLSAYRRIGVADAGIEHTKVIVYLGRCAYC